MLWREGVVLVTSLVRIMSFSAWGVTPTAPSLQNQCGQGWDHLPAACTEGQGTNPANAPQAAKYPTRVAGQALRAPYAAVG